VDRLLDDPAAPPGPLAEHGQIGTPGSDRVRVSARHDATHLPQVPEVVHDPGGEQLAQGDGPERGMESVALKVGGRQLQGADLRKALLARVFEGVEQRVGG